MAKYLYNDVEFPELPSGAYPYWHIQMNHTGSFYFLFNSEYPIYKTDNGEYAYKFTQSSWCDAYKVIDGVWDKSMTSGGSDNFYTSDLPILWASYNILNENGSVYLPASDPVPVGGEPEQPEPEPEEPEPEEPEAAPVVGLEWKKHDAYKPNIEWDGKTFYRVMGKKWVKQDAVVPAAAAVPVPDNCLIFSSAEPFTVATYYKVKSWDGALYYSTNGSTWSEWDGTTDIASAEHGGEQRIYMRGSGNSKISRQYYYPKNLVLTGNAIACSGNIETLLDHETVARGEHPTMAAYCFNYLFDGCTALTSAPGLPATTLAESCYSHMFYDCTSLLTPPELPASNLARACYDNMFRNCKGLSSLPKLRAITLSERCYASMFYGCTGIKLSETQTEEYKTEYRIPISGTGTMADYALIYMFTDTGGTFTGEPTINTTYYTSNTVV